jgi:hypothetical protein
MRLRIDARSRALLVAFFSGLYAAAAVVDGDEDDDPSVPSLG